SGASFSCIVADLKTMSVYSIKSMISFNWQTGSTDKTGTTKKMGTSARMSGCERRLKLAAYGF
ncbi:MAG: hypothetical protein WBN03_11210, partial [Desulfobacterales bacterium]